MASRFKGINASNLTKIEDTFSDGPDCEYHHNDLILRGDCLVDRAWLS